MSTFKDLAKGGWHPKSKDGKSKESWRGDFKGIDQVAGWMGKKKGSNPTDEEHISRPLSTLKDPSLFGPPPKNVHYHGGAALPNQITPDTGGLGAPLSKDEIRANQEAEEEEWRQAEEEAKPKPPPVPYRTDTTGLSTAHLPPPPGRRDGADGRGPASALAPSAKPKPSLPPRLPPRQNSNPAPSPSPTYAANTEPDTHKGMLNQGSLNRLGASGVSVPGFGIGNKPKALLPPPELSSPSRSPASSHSPMGNASQLNELQSRFSRLSSSTSPKPESPSESTTFAQKQAAFKTAQSFRNDPSSVSLSDARAAATTANNFRDRHGEQVKSGWQSANKLNTKYGLSDKLSPYGAVGNLQPAEAPSTGIEMGDNDQDDDMSGGHDFGIAGKKKPPPPPVKKAALASSGSANGAGSAPPPIPLSSKPKPQPTRSPESQPQMADFDLDLKSLWFAKQPAVFPPPSVNRLPGSRTYASSSGWSSSGVRKIHTFTGAIRDTTTLGTTMIHLTWDGSNPGLTVKSQQRHIPPPRKLSRSELDAYREQYSDALATWSESKMGQQVGNGECWTLAHDVLVSVASTCSSRGREPCMPSQSYTHGALIYTFIPTASPYPDPRGGMLAAGVVRGDVIQLLSAHFRSKDGRSEKWAGAPDHTAVITEVDGSREGVVSVVEQNVGGVKRVRVGEYDMSELIKGEVRIFRAVGESWVGKLEPRW